MEPDQGRTETVALVFTDIEGSTELWERDAALARSALAVHDAVIRQLIEDHGGYEMRHEGDAFKVGFADPGDAVRFVLALQPTLERADWPDGLQALIGATGSRPGLAVRAGGHLGNAERVTNPTTGRTEWSGTLLNETARIAAAPAGGQCVLSAALWYAARVTDAVAMDLGEHALRGIESSVRLFQVSAPELADRAFPPLRTATALRVNVPPATDRFFGRRGIDEEVHAALATHPVVTLMGPGGTGKTRLALEIARRFGHTWPGGVWFCELADARTAPEAAVAVSSSMRLGVCGEDTVATVGRMLAGFGPVLLVLDNLEQLGNGAAAVVSAWTRQAPEARFLATSRHALGVRGELRRPLDALSPEAAVALFVARAEDVGSDVAGDPVLASLVDRLDRLPLPIELAASRTDLMSPAEIERRLDQRFRLLSDTGASHPERHATLHAAIAWSWDLLDDDERAVAAQCSVFRGGFTTDAVEGIVELEAGWPVDVLQQLVRKSVIRQLPDRRLGMYESLKAWAAARLPDPEAVAERHARWFADRTVAWASTLAAATDFEDLRRLRVESENIVAAHDHLRYRDPVAAGRIVVAMGPEMLPHVPTGPVDLPADYLVRLAEALHAAREAGDTELEAMALRVQAEHRALALDLAGASEGFWQALEVARAHGHRYVEAVALRDLAFRYAPSPGDDAFRARERFALESVRIFTELGCPAETGLAWHAVLVLRSWARLDGRTVSDPEEASAHVDRLLAGNTRDQLGLAAISRAFGLLFQGQFAEAWALVREPVLVRRRYQSIGLTATAAPMVLGIAAAAGCGELATAEELVVYAQDAVARSDTPWARSLLAVGVGFVDAAKALAAIEPDERERHLQAVRSLLERIEAPGDDAAQSYLQRSSMTANYASVLRDWLEQNGLAV